MYNIGTKRTVTLILFHKGRGNTGIFGYTNLSISVPTPLVGNVIELRERAFLFKVKPEGLTEYSPRRQPWYKDLIIFLALKGRHII